MEWPAIALFVSLAGLVGAGSAVFVRLAGNDRRAVWAHVAAARGAVYHPGPGWLSLDPGRIGAEIGGVSIDVHVIEHGCRARAVVAPGAFPRFQIRREELFHTLGRVFGRQDVVIGTHALFDEMFLVRCDAPAAVRRLWSVEAMARVARHLTLAEMSSDGRVIELREKRSWADLGTLLAVLDVLAELGARDVFGSEALRAVAGARFIDGPPGDSPRAEIDVPARVSIAAEDVDGALVTVARLAEDPGMDPRRLEVDASGRLADPGLASALPQGAHIHLPRAGAGRLVIEPGGTRFEWADIELDPTRLRAAADLLCALCAGGPGGVYR